MSANDYVARRDPRRHSPERQQLATICAMFASNDGERAAALQAGGQTNA
jgi:hypothetical protein